MIKAHIRAVGLLALAVVLFSRCTKIDTTSLGSGLIPGVDNIHTFDTTLNIIATNYDGFGTCDSIIKTTDLHALGVINNNPQFGSSSAEMYLELKPGSYPFSLPVHDSTKPVIVDSVVLVLKYAYSDGDTTISQKVNVYQLTQPLKADSLYNICDQLGYDPFLLGQKTFVPKQLYDSVHAFKEEDASQLRIPMNKSLGEFFVNNASLLITDSAFVQMFKGFAIVPDGGVGGQALNYFDITSSRLSIYVRSQRDTIIDTSAINLTFNVNCGHANYVKVSRGTSEITQHLSVPANGDSLLFIQTAPGSYAKLKIPGLSNLPNVVIHRAELIAEQVYDPAATMFITPRQLFLEVPSLTDTTKYIPVPCDFNINQLSTGFTYFGGTANSFTSGGGQQLMRYTFNISRYVQGIVSKHNPNRAFRLTAPYYIHNPTEYTDDCNQVISAFYYPLNSVGDGSVKLEGSTQSPSRIRLRIVYSVL